MLAAKAKAGFVAFLILGHPGNGAFLGKSLDSGTSKNLGSPLCPSAPVKETRDGEEQRRVTSSMWLNSEEKQIRSPVRY